MALSFTQHISWMLGGFAAAVVASAPASAAVTVSKKVPAQAAPRLAQAYDSEGFAVDIRTVADFYAPLSPYGHWVAHRDYGQVFIPDVQVTGANFRPYTQGQWVSTEAGWAFDATLPFGWATAHYGRWGHSRRLGWYWVPGVTWAPAWVSWRTSDAHIGWAPMGPGVTVHTHVTVANDWWVFAPVAAIGAVYVADVLLHGHSWQSAYRYSRVRRRTWVHHGHTYYRGPDYGRVRRRGARVRTCGVRDVTPRDRRGRVIVRSRPRTTVAHRGRTGRTRQTPGTRDGYTGRTRQTPGTRDGYTGRTRRNGTTGRGTPRATPRSGTTGRGTPRATPRSGTTGRGTTVGTRPDVRRPSGPNRGQPVRTTPGRTAPGRTAPGRTAPGRATPGRTAPGRATPGRTAPGRATPGRTAPGRGGVTRPNAPIATRPDRLPPIVGDHMRPRPQPGRTAPGRTAPGRTAPGRTAPGRTAGTQPGRRGGRVRKPHLPRPEANLLPDHLGPTGPIGKPGMRGRVNTRGGLQRTSPAPRVNRGGMQLNTRQSVNRAVQRKSVNRAAQRKSVSRKASRARSRSRR